MFLWQENKKTEYYATAYSNSMNYLTHLKLMFHQQTQQPIYYKALNCKPIDWFLYEWNTCLKWFNTCFNLNHNSIEITKALSENRKKYD